MRRLSWLVGYVIVRLPRGGTAFLREAASEGLGLSLLAWGGGGLRAAVLLTDLGCLRRVVRKSGTRVAIEGGVGLPFVARRIGRRRALVVALLAVLVAWGAVGQTVQAIDVHGAPTGVRNEVIRSLEGEGVAPWRFKGFVDRDRAIRNLKRIPGVLWAALAFDGTHAVVNIHMAQRPTLPPPPPVAKLVASKRGIVTRIVVYRGVASVKRGDAVLPGEVLISAYGGPPPEADTPGGALEPLSAAGVVDALVERQLILRLPLMRRTTVEAGPRVWRLRLMIPGRSPITLRTGRNRPGRTRTLFRREAAYRGFALELAETEPIRVVLRTRRLAGVLAAARRRARQRLESRSPKGAKWLGWREGYKIEGTLLVYTLRGTVEEDIARPVGRRSSRGPD